MNTENLKPEDQSSIRSSGVQRQQQRHGVSGTVPERARLVCWSCGGWFDGPSVVVRGRVVWSSLCHDCTCVALDSYEHDGGDLYPACRRVYERWSRSPAAEVAVDTDQPVREPETCLCDVSEPDSFGNRDKIVNPDCPTCGPVKPPARRRRLSGKLPDVTP